MTDSSDRSAMSQGDTLPKPAASLSDIKIQRPGRSHDDGQKSKPGDLTSILAERRQGAEARPEEDVVVEDLSTQDSDTAEGGASVDDEKAQATTAETVDPTPQAPSQEAEADQGSPAGPAPNGARRAVEVAPKSDATGSQDNDATADSADVEEHAPASAAAPADAGPAEIEPPPAKPKSRTLRERLKAQRSAPRKATPAPPEKSAEPIEAPPPEPPEQPQQPAARIADESAPEATAAPEAPSAQQEAPVAPEAPEAPVEDEPAEAPAAKESVHTSIRNRITRRKDSAAQEAEDDADIVTDALLRKRMAAVLQSETKRREEWEARQDEKARTDSATEEPTVEIEPVAQPESPKWSPPPKPADIVRYWTLARRGRRLPALSDLDVDEIARNWPDSLLLRYVAESHHLELERSLVRRPSVEPGQADEPERKIDYTPDVIDWVVHQGLIVTKDGNPVRATEEFDAEDGIARYRVVALPLGENGTDIDHILCHLEPA